MKILGFIPARYDSTRFPGKPLALIAGKPMIQHVYDRALLCGELSDVCVATDDERILACVQGFGGKAVMTGGEHRSGTDRITEAALMEGAENEDIIVNIQGDQPLFEPALIRLMVEPLVEDMSIPMSTLKWRIIAEDDIGNPNHVKVVTDRKGFAMYFSRHAIPFFRSPVSKAVHFKHLGFYAFRMGFLVQYTSLPEGILESCERLEQLRALENGFKIKVLETAYDSIEVDVPEDIKTVEGILLD